LKHLDAGRPPSLAGATALALAAVALALRLYHLQLQSLWWDEGISLYLAGLDLASLTTAKDFGIDLHPPLYHVLLAGWVRLAGSSVFSSRYLSAAAGALAVPLTYYLGRRTSGPAAGLVGAVLLAASPFHVFYSQEARMYTLVPLLGLLSTALALRILDRQAARPGEWVALAVVNAAGLYAYYYLALLVLAENVAFAAVVSTSPPAPSPLAERGSGGEADVAGRLRQPGLRALVFWWLGAQAATALLYLPWLAALWGLFASGAAMAVPPETAVYRSLAGYLRECLLAFSIGFARPAPWADLAGGLALALAALAGRPKGRAGWWLLSLGIAVPLAGAYLVMLRRPFFFPRFIIYAAPLLYVLVGAGVARLASLGSPSPWERVRARAVAMARGGLAPALSQRQREQGARLVPSPIAPRVRRWGWGRLAARGLAALLAAGCLAALLAGEAQSLASHYTSLRTGYSSSDYRVVLADLADLARPGDAVVATYPWQAGYVAGYLPNAGLATAYAAAAPGAPREAEADRLLGQHPRVWLLLYSADGRWGDDPLERALAGAGAPAFVDQFGDSRVRLFSATPPALAPSPAARLGDRVALLRYAVGPAGPRHPGEVVDLTLTWQALAPVPDSYTVFTHLLGPDGRVWGQQDSPPLAGARPTSTWRPGEVIVDRYRLAIAADAPAGEYLAEAGLYQPSTGQRLPVGRSPEEADRVVVGRFTVVR